ncbi:methyltransferase domain-containing protein [Elioraea sp.]|uniref:methyltransferase domain-containing protein n=1 Tax=Elioraea sp. TaxID=2185103 RepID=UPI003F6FBA4B
MTACQVCRSSRIGPALDMGSHPVSSFFLPAADAPETAHRLALTQCAECGTIQLMTPVPHAALKPPYDWLFAREPEEHLDGLVDRLRALPGLEPGAAIAGLTVKDDTTLDRFRRHGFERVWRVSLAEDLGIADPCANVETVQVLTEPDRMRRVAAAHGGPADLLIVRHVIEHAESLQAFVEGLAALVRPGGYVMVEAPDCTTSLRLHDYAMVWEEHSLYFTPATLRPILEWGGFERVFEALYPLPFENCMVLVARRTGMPRTPQPDAEGQAQAGLLARYAAAFPDVTAELRRTLEAVRARGPLALFGAGHLACAFVNFHGLADLFDFVADDTPQKQGLFLPGARLPILPSAELVRRRVALCLLALSIGNEDRVIARNAGFIAAGGAFRSIFAASPRSIRGPAG